MPSGNAAPGHAGDSKKKRPRILTTGVTFWRGAPFRDRPVSPIADFMNATPARHNAAPGHAGDSNENGPQILRTGV
eukprot:11558445-Karenia_brevis.AAC.1